MSKKGNGFTLVELLAVLAVMAAILLIAVPTITGQLSSIEEGKYNQFKQNLYLATETYVNANIGRFPDLKNTGKSYCITIETLITNGWIKSTLNNPKTGVNVSENKKGNILVKNCSGEYKYAYLPNGSCTGKEITC